MDFWLLIAILAVTIHLVTDIRLGLVAATRLEHKRDLWWTIVTVLALSVHMWMDWR